MARKRKIYDDDDGRTIADMSGVSRPQLFTARGIEVEKPMSAEPEETEDRPWEDNSLTRKERSWFIFGALKAALLIALAFIAGLGLVIWLIIALYT